MAYEDSDACRNARLYNKTQGTLFLSLLLSLVWSSIGAFVFSKKMLDPEGADLCFMLGIMVMILPFWWIKEKGQDYFLAIVPFAFIGAVSLGIALVLSYVSDMNAPISLIEVASSGYGFTVLISAVVAVFKRIEQKKGEYSYAIVIFTIISVICYSIYMTGHTYNSSILKFCGDIANISAIVAIFQWVKQKKWGYPHAIVFFLLISALSLSLLFSHLTSTTSSFPSMRVVGSLGLTAMMSTIIAVFRWMKQKNRRKVSPS